jgi:hypothetical protein
MYGSISTKFGGNFVNPPMKGLPNVVPRSLPAATSSSVFPTSFGMATVCPPGFKANKRYRAKRGQRQCKKINPNKVTKKELQALAAANGVSIYKRRKDDVGFTKQPLSVKALKYRLTKMRVPYGDGSNLRPPTYTEAVASGVPVMDSVPVATGVPVDDLLGLDFGMATVCPPGFRPNKKYRAKPGQRQCLKGAPKKTLKELQAIALANDVSIFKRSKEAQRRGEAGFTKTPLTKKSLSARLTRMKVPH